MSNSTPEPQAVEQARQKALAQEMQNRMNTMYQLADRLATLATGALTLTVTFRKDLAATSTDALCMLRDAWLCFILTVVGFVVIHLSKMKLHQSLAVVIGTGDTSREVIPPPWYFHLGRYLLVWGFLLGLILLACFGTFMR